MAKPQPSEHDLAIWAQYRAGANALLKRMTPEGKANAQAFWEKRKPTPHIAPVPK
jgi:hypothetical protein